MLSTSLIPASAEIAHGPSVMGRISIGRSSHGMTQVNTSKYHPPADRLKSAIFYAVVSEWFKEPVLKTGDTERYRGFKSHPQRHNNLQGVWKACM